MSQEEPTPSPPPVTSADENENKENKNSVQDTQTVKNSYLTIRLNSLIPDTPIPFDLFVKIDNKQIHYLKEGDRLAASKLQSLQQKAQERFSIHSRDKKKYKDYIHKCLTCDNLAIKNKALILRESSISLMEELFESPDVDQALRGSKDIIQNFVEFMDQDSQSMAHLVGLSTHDFYTYNHSLDVGIYSLGLGQVLGFQGEDLQSLGEGALLHDIGKRHVNVDIICKKGPLNEIEWMQMKKHPSYGLQILDAHNVSEDIKACCFEHHESFLGNGYPQALQSHEIHPMAKIIAITDTYDALTTQRSYNLPKFPIEAIEYMTEKLTDRYDKTFLKAMSSILFKLKKPAELSP